MKSVQRKLVKYFMDIYNNQDTTVYYHEIEEELNSHDQIKYTMQNSTTFEIIFCTIKLISMKDNKRFMEVDLKVHRDTNKCNVRSIRTNEYTMYLGSADFQIIYKTPQKYNKPQNSTIRCLRGLNARTRPAIQQWMSTDKIIIAKRIDDYKDIFASAPRDIKAFEYTMRTGEIA